MHSGLRHLSRSLFTRLGLIMVVAVLAINSIIHGLFLHYRQGRETADTRNLLQYARYLAQEVGSPPDKERAEQLAHRLHMRITSQGAQIWSVGVLQEKFPARRLRTWHSSDTVEAARLHGYQRIRVKADDGSWLTFDILPTAEERSEFKRLAWLSLALTCLVMLAAYAAMRWLLQPVRWLTEGAAIVRDGNLLHRVPERHGGELLDLSRTFNQMVASVQGLLGAQQRLLLDASHELRTPITRMKLQLEMLPDSAGAQAMRGDLLEMEGLITGILQTARMRHEAGNLDLVEEDLSALLAGAAARYGGQHPGILERYPSDPVLARVDGDKVAIVVRNLLDNALKYSAADDDPVELALAEEDGFALVTVRDHGIGIPAEAMPHLFQPFFRVDGSRTRATGGFGLGLSLCQAIVQAHGGRIGIDSEPGRGTTVTVALPTQGGA